MDEQNKSRNTEQDAAVQPGAKRPAPRRDVPRRRVGSLTLGVCLIAAGIFFLCYYFVPGFGWQLALKIAPAAALILLGCEVLFFARRPEHWKYDFMSVFVCLVLIAGCFCLSLLPKVWDEVDPARQQNAMKLEKEYTEQVYAQIKEDAPQISVQDVSCDVYLYTNVDSLDDVEADNGHLELRLALFGPYKTAKAFAEDCRALADAVLHCGKKPDQLVIICDPQDKPENTLESGTLSQTEAYTLTLSGPAQLDWTTEQMESCTSVQSLLDEENNELDEAESTPAEAYPDSAAPDADKTGSRSSVD